GIRDLTVTGVQTCALPIWALGRKRSVVDATGDRRWDVLRPGRFEAPFDERVRHARGVLVREVRLHRDVGTDLLTGRDEQRGLVEIGRASCRERVWRRVGGG